MGHFDSIFGCFQKALPLFRYRAKVLSGAKLLFFE